MKQIRITLLVVLLVCMLKGMAQTRVYKNYDVQDGLAGSIVHYGMQDSKGFMWFATDQGVSRFDGANFESFTTDDGLPDNEIFRLSEDSMGRVWGICYNTKPFYIYHSKVYNGNNDTLIKQIGGGDLVFRNVVTDRQGRVWLLGGNLYVIDGYTVSKFNSIVKGVPGSGVGYIGNKFCITTVKGIYEANLTGGKLQYKPFNETLIAEASSPLYLNNSCYVFEIVSGGPAIQQCTFNQNKKVLLSSFGIKDVVLNCIVYNPTDSSIIISAGIKGLKAFTTNFDPLPDPFSYLPGNTSYSYVCYDNEGNIWVTSLGSGVFFIPFNKKILYTNKASQGNNNVTSVFKFNNGAVIAGFDYSHYGVLQKDSLIPCYTTTKSFARSRIVRQCLVDSNTLLLGADEGLYTINKNSPLSCSSIPLVGIKNLCFEGEDSALVATFVIAARIIKKDKQYLVDTLWVGRSTAISKGKDGKIWIGTLGGLYTVSNGKVEKYETYKELSNLRITDLSCDKYGNIWVATHQRGVFIITPNTIVEIDKSNGLASNTCVRLYREADSIMWVCSNHSLGKIVVSGNGKQQKFAVQLPAEWPGNKAFSVNDVFVDNDNIWLATANGLLQIERTINKTTIAPSVYITSFKTADSVYNYENPVTLKYFQNDPQIVFIGISHSSNGNITYKYVLDADSPSDTVYTSNATLNISALSPGDYSLKVWARNAFGIWSKAPAVMPFTILPPFWQTWWFIGLLALLLLLIIIIAFRWRVNIFRKREHEKTTINKRIAEVELQAIKAHMNEHFIFNSLNSIQNYINQNNTEAANYYLSNFGKLIRRTMDISTMQVITLEDEINYLNTYLILEKMRFDDAFVFKIVNETIGATTDEILLPSMILQPYVENAIRHGLRYKEEGNGKLDIIFSVEGDFLVCTIDDNGIGRKKAKELKSKTHVEYQSKGISLSEDKIYLFNTVHQSNIRSEIIDKTDGTGKALGTLVRIYVMINK